MTPRFIYLGMLSVVVVVLFLVGWFWPAEKPAKKRRPVNEDEGP